MSRAFAIWLGTRLRKTRLQEKEHIRSQPTRLPLQQICQLGKPRACDRHERKQNSAQKNQAKMMELVRALQNLRRQETAKLTDQMMHQSELLQRDRLTLANYEYLARRFCCLRCPALPARARNRLFPAVNPQLKKSYEKKTKSLKLADLTPQKDAKGGAGKASAPSSSSTPTVPTSLDEFLKRDSLSIKR